MTPKMRSKMERIYSVETGQHIATVWAENVKDELADGESWMQMRDRTQVIRNSAQQETFRRAELFSAAPDLLEIVQELLAEEDERLAQIAGFVEALGIDPSVKARMDKMRAAIAKATGTA